MKFVELLILSRSIIYIFVKKISFGLQYKNANISCSSFSFFVTQLAHADVSKLGGKKVEAFCYYLRFLLLLLTFVSPGKKIYVF